MAGFETSTKVPPRLANSSGFQQLEQAGLQEQLPTIRIPQPAAPPAVTPGAVAAQRAALLAARAGMVTRALGGVGMALAPAAGGALGYGLAAHNLGMPVLPAMVQGAQNNWAGQALTDRMQQ